MREDGGAGATVGREPGRLWDSGEGEGWELGSGTALTAGALVVADAAPPDGAPACHLQHPGQQRQHRLLAALLLQGQVTA